MSSYNVHGVFGNVAYSTIPKCLIFENILTKIEAKVYNYLVEMVKYNSAEKRISEPYYIGRQGEIAKYLNCTRQSINRAVGTLVEFGLITTYKLYDGSPLKYVINDITQSKLYRMLSPSRRYPLSKSTDTNNNNDKPTIELTEEQQKLRNYVYNKLTKNQVKILWETAVNNNNIDDDKIYDIIINIVDNIKYKGYVVKNLHGYLKKAIKTYKPTNSNNTNMIGKADTTILNLDTLKNHVGLNNNDYISNNHDYSINNSCIEILTKWYQHTNKKHCLRLRDIRENSKKMYLEN